MTAFESKATNPVPHAQILETVRCLVAEIARVSVDQIAPETCLVDGAFKLDSLDLQTVFARLAETYALDDVDPADEQDSFQTPALLCEFVIRHLSAQE